MTSSSSPGIALKSEGISYCAAARIPLVYVNVSRGGPGVGVIQPAQADYFQATKASGNGGFRMRVFAPATVQEAVDMTYKAFDYADEDRNPVLILTDGVIGSILEPVVLPPMRTDEEIAAFRAAKTWAATGHKLGEGAWINPGGWDQDLWERINKEAWDLYSSWTPEWESYLVEDAEIVLSAYGIAARIAMSAVDELRTQGIKAGLIRAKTVYPFPYQAFDEINYDICKGVLNCEMSIPPQFYEDVDHAVDKRAPIYNCLRAGGHLLSINAIIDQAKEIVK